MNDRRLKVDQIAETLGISHGSVETILHEKLGMFKIDAPWVPRILTLVQKADRMETSSDLLGFYRSDPAGFCVRIATGDETWIHH